MPLNINDPDYHEKVAAMDQGKGSPVRHTEASAGPTGKEHLRTEQFGRHAKGNTPNQGQGGRGTRGNSYAGSHRGKPANEAGSSPGKHRADHKHEAPYSAGKDIGASIGSTKKPEYKGKHQKQGPIPHAKGKANMGGGAGRSNVPPPPDIPSKSAGGTDNAKSHAKSKANLEKAKGTNKGQVHLKFRPSRHEGKNKEHLRNLVK